MGKLLLLLCLFTACRREITYEEGTLATMLDQRRYLVQAQVNPISVAIEWVHRKAHEVCGGDYMLEGASATNEVRPVNIYGRTYVANRQGYVATAICGGSDR